MKKSDNYTRLILFLILSFLLLVTPMQAFAQAATLSLDPSGGTFNQSCSFSLNINLDTGGAQTDGTDAIILYDTSRLDATSVVSGTIYTDYPGNNIDSSTGKITISGIASASTPFSGEGTLATINFTVQSSAPAGATQVTFDFNPKDKAKTTDSNVVQTTTVVDVLNSVVNGRYTIGTGSCAGGPSPSPTAVSPALGQGAASIATPSARPVVPAATLPPAGSEQLTFAIAIIGGALTVLGILGLALL